MSEKRLVVTVYERTKLLQALKELGFTWVEGEGILDRILITMAPNSLVPSQREVTLNVQMSSHFSNWLYNLGLESELYYLGKSHLGRRFDTELFQTIYSQFDLDNYIENSEIHVSRFVLKDVLKLFSQFTWEQIVFIKEIEVFS